MSRYFRGAAIAESCASRPDEAWYFARAVLGDQVAGPFNERATERAHREQLLEWLAKLSSEHESRLPPLAREHAVATYERRQFEWLAQISSRHERPLQRLLAAQAQTTEVPGRINRVADGSSVLEAKWDPAKHPRRGTAPNPGWFASTGGASTAAPRSTGQGSGVGVVDARSQTIGKTNADAANAGHGDAALPRDSASSSTAQVGFASHAGRKRVAAQQVSVRKGVGHHWAPKSVVFDAAIRPLLSDEAAEYAMGAYSGPTDPSHNYGTYGGVKHSEYNRLVKDELKQFMKTRKIKKMTVEQMQEFISLIDNGLDAAGKPHAQIAAFNEAIKKALPKGTRVPKKLDDVIAAGRKYMKHPRFKMLAAGAFISGLLSDAVGDQAGVLEVASKSGHYRRAVQSLEDGDLASAQRLLVGDGDSLYMEILLRVGARPALNFRAAMEKVFESARNREYK